MAQNKKGDAAFQLIQLLSLPMDETSKTAVRKGSFAKRIDILVGLTSAIEKEMAARFNALNLDDPIDHLNYKAHLLAKRCKKTVEAASAWRRRLGFSGKIVGTTAMLVTVLGLSAAFGSWSLGFLTSNTANGVTGLYGLLCVGAGLTAGVALNSVSHLFQRTMAGWKIARLKSYASKEDANLKAEFKKITGQDFDAAVQKDELAPEQNKVAPQQDLAAQPLKTEAASVQTPSPSSNAVALEEDLEALFGPLARAIVIPEQTAPVASAAPRSTLSGTPAPLLALPAGAQTSPASRPSVRRRSPVRRHRPAAAPSSVSGGPN